MILTNATYENNGVVGAICHGSSALINVKLSNGRYLIENKRVSGFTNDEEVAMKLDKVVPFLLQDKLSERGGIYNKAGNFQDHISVDQRLVTGQNPQSAKSTGEAIVAQIKNAQSLSLLITLNIKSEYQKEMKAAIAENITMSLQEEGNMSMSLNLILKK